jgi:acetyl esterase/lipase
MYGGKDKRGYRMINSEIRLVGKIKGTLIDILLANEKRIAKIQKTLKKIMLGKTSKKIKCEEAYIDKSGGGKLRVCIYKPLDLQGDAAGLLWMHGGGYAIGAPEMDIGYAEKLISAADCVIVSPDYTLSTEKPYPAALEDCYDTLLWMKSNAAGLGVRENQLFVGGNSAGGGLAIAVSLYARDKGEVNIAFQMPLYPMIDDRMSTGSAKDNNTPIWNSRNNALAWRMYLGALHGKDDVPKYAAPARETDYSNLPPAYTFVGDIEPFFDETVAYVQNLQKAGVSAKADVYEGCFHAFDNMCPKAGISQRAVSEMLSAFRFAVDNYFL